MLVLGFDTETTGLDTTTDRVVEVGAVLWDTEKKFHVHTLSKLIWEESFPDPSPDSIKAHGLTKDFLQAHGLRSSTVFGELEFLMGKAEYIVAHNGHHFDFPLLKAEMGRAKGAAWDFGLGKIDTMLDIPYPEDIKQRALKYLATDHGFINPFPHRAEPDEFTMLRVMSNYDISEVIRLSKFANVKLYARVEYKDRQLVKDRKYMWDGTEKVWWKGMKECFVEKEVSEAPFEIKVVRET